MTAWTPSEDKHLIKVIQDFPIIYDDRNREDDTNVQNTWREISQILDKNAADCKTRWENIYDQYMISEKGDKNGFDCSDFIHMLGFEVKQENKESITLPKDLHIVNESKLTTDSIKGISDDESLIDTCIEDDKIGVVDTEKEMSKNKNVKHERSDNEDMNFANEKHDTVLITMDMIEQLLKEKTEKEQEEKPIEGRSSLMLFDTKLNLDFELKRTRQDNEKESIENPSPLVDLSLENTKEMAQDIAINNLKHDDVKKETEEKATKNSLPFFIDLTLANNVQKNKGVEINDLEFGTTICGDTKCDLLTSPSKPSSSINLKDSDLEFIKSTPCLCTYPKKKKELESCNEDVHMSKITDYTKKKKSGTKNGIKPTKTVNNLINEIIEERILETKKKITNNQKVNDFSSQVDDTEEIKDMEKSITKHKVNIMHEEKGGIKKRKIRTDNKMKPIKKRRKNINSDKEGKKLETKREINSTNKNKMDKDIQGELHSKDTIQFTTEKLINDLASKINNREKMVLEIKKNKSKNRKLGNKSENKNNNLKTMPNPEDCNTLSFFLNMADYVVSRFTIDKQKELRSKICSLVTIEESMIIKEKQ